MSTYYVGSGGSDSNAGTSWGARFLTLGKAATSVAAGDTVYAGPGVYRESVTISTSGSGGSPVTWIGDNTGAHTDGVGGVCRVTGSDNDTTKSRATCFVGTDKSYQTIQGFAFDMASGTSISILRSAGSPSDWIIQDCTFAHVTTNCISWPANSGNNLTVQRCFFLRDNSTTGVLLTVSTGTVTGVTVQNCYFQGGSGTAISTSGGATCTVTVNGCTFCYLGTAVSESGATTVVNVNNCIFNSCNTAMSGASGRVVEDYNALFGNVTNRTGGMATGSNSNAFPPLFEVPRLFSGSSLPYSRHGMPSQWSQVARITGTGAPSDDLTGQARPATAAKIGWGAVQYVDRARETSTVFAGSASIKLADATIVTMFKPITSAAPINITAYVYSEANYAGTAPQIIIRQPGQSDTTVTDAGSTGAWNLLSTTITPATSPQWIEILLVSNNTATSGSYAVYFDSIGVV